MASVPSREYWELRAANTLIANEKSVAQYEKDLKRAYNATLRRIEKELEAFYHKYATENQISLAEARRNLKDVKQFKEEIDNYIEIAQEKASDPRYRTYLRNLSRLSQYTRMQQVMTSIRHELEVLAATQNEMLTQVLEDGYEDAFYRTLYDVNKAAGFGVNFDIPGKVNLHTTVSTKWLGDSYSDRIWTNKNKLVTQLDQLIPQDFVRGRGAKEVSKDISKRLDVSYSNALRLARTEMNHVSSQASLEAYSKSGVVKQYQFSAVLDGLTSDICRELDGQVFDLDDAQTGVNKPPMHPNCRSTDIPYFPDDEISALIIDRVARDNFGKTYRVGSNVTYQEWVDKHARAAYAKRVKNNPTRYAEMDNTPDVF